MIKIEILSSPDKHIENLHELNFNDVSIGKTSGDILIYDPLLFNNHLTFSCCSSVQ